MTPPEFDELFANAPKGAVALRVDVMFSARKGYRNLQPACWVDREGKGMHGHKVSGVAALVPAKQVGDMVRRRACFNELPVPMRHAA